jgi:hypothetical protein
MVTFGYGYQIKSVANIAVPLALHDKSFCVYNLELLEPPICNLSKSDTEGFFIEVRVDIAFNLSFVPFVALVWPSLRRQKFGNIS